MKRIANLIISSSIPLMPAASFEDIEPLKPEELAGTKFSKDGEIRGKRSKGDRKRNPRWSRQ
ncbi:hypothetical protein [Pseudorhizobium pelagicum]|uniref:hypothetical protein n=1 Tax=Pseudorhizobium pelagicum TaxID=1509405 RepID=UPI0011115787|nr:hypothetical protein [Pseudorhizobium pelagicum]